MIPININKLPIKNVLFIIVGVFYLLLPEPLDIPLPVLLEPPVLIGREGLKFLFVFRCIVSEFLFCLILSERLMVFRETGLRTVWFRELSIFLLLEFNVREEVVKSLERSVLVWRNELVAGL